MENCTVSLANKTSVSVLGLLVPNDSPYWTPRTQGWYVFFYLLIVIYGVLFLGFGVCCAILLAKRHLAQRFKVRTFIAIDLALIILGFSRFIFLVIDPWGQSGFCTHYACVVVSRLLGALAFPSLTASYTLVFITLWISARIQLGRSCVQKLKILIPLCCIHYAAALCIETINLIPQVDSIVVLVLIVICEAIFSSWGFLVCLFFFIGGFRLLKTLEKTVRDSSVICRDSPNMTRHDLIERSRFKNQTRSPQEVRNRSMTTMKLKHMLQSKQKAALRKITRITYTTVILGMLYSLLSITNLLVFSFSLLDGCPGDLQGLKMLPEIWLTLRYVFFTIEICMGILLTYAVTDYTPLIQAFRKVFMRCCGASKLRCSPEVADKIANPSTSTATTLDNDLSPNSKVGKATAFSAVNAKYNKSSVSRETSVSCEEKDEVAPESPRPCTPKNTSPLVVSFSAEADEAFNS